MITIDKVFAAKKCNRGWELHETRPSKNEKSKSGFSTDITYPASLRLLAMAVIEKSSGDCKTGDELIEHIDRATVYLAKVLFRGVV